MPDQPAGIQQGIADVARKHYFWWPNHSSIGMEAHCQCGERPRDWSYWADHFAEVLTSELGLIEERQHKHPFGHGDQQEIRYVTEWSDE